jgi:hypothetical protein
MGRSESFEAHQGEVELKHSFDVVEAWLRKKGKAALSTAAGTRFTARTTVTQRGKHTGEPVIRFFQGNTEFARAYKCCWGHYYNCNRTRMGMYCQALDSELEA